MDKKDCFSCGSVIEAAFKFCPECGCDLRQHGCPACGAENRAGCKFCQQCGQALEQTTSQNRRRLKAQAQDSPIQLDAPPKSGVTIEFPYSSAQTFEFALAEAKKFESFRQYGEDRKAIYRMTIPANQLETANELIEYLKGWRRRTVYVDGEKNTWESVFAYTWCYVKKNASFRSDLYCFGFEQEYEFNIWGCIQARLPFREHAPWFSWGTFLNDNGDWKFDKERIRHELQKALYPVRFCPALRPELVEEVLNALPDVVNPKSDRNWKFLESWGDENAPGLVMTISRFGMKEKVLIKGVCPNGTGALKEIAKRMKNKLPATEIAN